MDHSPYLANLVLSDYWHLAYINPPTGREKPFEGFNQNRQFNKQRRVPKDPLKGIYFLLL